MDRNIKETIYLARLIEEARQGVISEERLSELDDILKHDASAREMFLEYSYIDLALRRFLDNRAEMSHVLHENMADDTHAFNEALSALAEDQLTAPAIEVPKAEPQRELIEKVVYMPRQKREVSKFQLFTFIASIAAILFFIAFPKLFPKPSSNSVEVATFIDLMDVQWGNNAVADIEKGSRLWADDGFLDLQKGIVRIRYDDGVDVLVEGPALFDVERGGLFLEYGRVYSHVSDSGLGFTVKTPTSQFVDQGTEFGVLAGINGASEVHVVKGKVQLFAKSRNRTKEVEMVTAGEALRYEKNSGQIKAIPCEKTAFVRRINSKARFAWRGETFISLADIVGGGNGLGTGMLDQVINPLTGAVSMSANRHVPEYTLVGTGRYVEVPDIAFIDGVFIPDGGLGAVQITSTGLQIPDFPDTGGGCWRGINHSGQFTYIDGVSRSKAILDGHTFDSKERPAILMSANVGVTFDLDAIRAGCPGLPFERFTAKCGITQDLPKQRAKGDGVFGPPACRFMVYVGDDCRFEKRAEVPGKAENISIDLAETDRFLTLINVDEGEHALDWGVFADPRLE